MNRLRWYRRSLSLLLLAVLLGGPVTPALARPAPLDQGVVLAGGAGGAGKSEKAKGERRRGLRYPLPFRFGERLVYSVKFSRFPVYATIGELTFSVNDVKGSTRHVKFEVEAVSKGALVSLFGISVHDIFTSLVDRDDMFVYSTIKNLHEGDQRQRHISVFDRGSKRVQYAVSNPSNAAQAPKAAVYDARPWTQDIVSALYFARTRKYARENREIAFPMTDEAAAFDIGVAALGREEVKIDLGSFKTIRVDARIFDGRYIRRSGALHVWLTDDARRIPVKAQLKTSGGTATFELIRLEEGSEPIVPFKPSAATDDGE